jgi:chromosome segregation ATPase
MAANGTFTGRGGTKTAVARQLNRLKAKVKELTLKLEREVKARKLDARLAAEAKKIRAQLAGQIKSLREHGRKLASELKSAVGDAGKRERMLKEARKKTAALKTELARKTAELTRKSAELKKLVEESVHRAATIIRSDRQPAAEPTEAASSTPPASSEPASTNKAEST